MPFSVPSPSTLLPGRETCFAFRNLIILSLRSQKTRISVLPVKHNPSTRPGGTSSISQFPHFCPAPLKCVELVYLDSDPESQMFLCKVPKPPTHLSFFQRLTSCPSNPAEAFLGRSSSSLPSQDPLQLIALLIFTPPLFYCNAPPSFFFLYPRRLQLFPTTSNSFIQRPSFSVRSQTNVDLLCRPHVIRLGSILL